MHENKPTSKELLILKKIEILNLLRDKTTNEVSVIVGIPLQSVRNYKAHFKAYSEEEIDRAIRILEDNLSTTPSIFNYDKQENCEPRRIYFHCYDCSFSATENNLKGIKEHIKRCKVNTKLLTKQSL